MPFPFNAADYLYCQEIIDTSDGTPFTTGGSRQYTRRWDIIVKDKGMGANAVCCHPALPRPYSIYQSYGGTESDPLAVLVSFRAKRKVSDEFYHWSVEATYSTEVPEGGIPLLTEVGSNPIGSQNNPWDERPVVDWDWEETTEAPARDLDGRAYTNSATMPFVPAPQFPADRSVLVITRNEKTIDRVVMQAYSRAVNSDVFLGADPGTVRAAPIRVKLMNRGPLQYVRVTYRLVFNLPYEPLPGEKVLDGKLQSWQPEILDQGTHQLQKIPLVPFTGKPVPIIRYGAPVNHPVLLDGLGREAVPDGTGFIKPSFRKFRQFKAQPFTPIIERGLFGGP